MINKKRQSPIAEKWNEILKKWKDIPPPDNSIAPWPLSRGFNKDNQSEQPETTKKIINRTNV